MLIIKDFTLKVYKDFIIYKKIMLQTFSFTNLFQHIKFGQIKSSVLEFLHKIHILIKI